MPLFLPLHIVMMSKHSKFGTLSTFWVMGYIKVFAWWQRRQWWRSSDHNSWLFLWNRQAKNITSRFQYAFPPPTKKKRKKKWCILCYIEKPTACMSYRNVTDYRGILFTGGIRKIRISMSTTCTSGILCLHSARQSFSYFIGEIMSFLRVSIKFYRYEN